MIQESASAAAFPPQRILWEYMPRVCLLNMGAGARRDKLDLVARLFSVSAQGLQSNPHLVTMVLGVKSALMAAAVPLVAGVAVAYQNGAVVQNGLRKGDVCVNEEGTQVPCCAWQTDR